MAVASNLWIRPPRRIRISLKLRFSLSPLFTIHHVVSGLAIRRSFILVEFLPDVTVITRSGFSGRRC
jgi:hypothetical protein